MLIIVVDGVAIFFFKGGAQSTHCWRNVIPQGLILDVRSGAWLDIICGKYILWWLWICNLGNHTRSVIGVGVRDAHLAMNTNHEAVFKFSKTECTQCVVRLVCMSRERLQVYV